MSAGGPDHCFVFVVHAGELEIKASLLVASLRKFLSSRYELVGALPGPEAVWGRPSREVLAFFEQMGVRPVAVNNPIGASHPIGNKLTCLSIPTTAKTLVFLDSDILCLADFQPGKRSNRQFHAKPADLATAGNNPDFWRGVFGYFGLNMPAKWVLTTISGELIPPYFNAGVIAVERDAALGPVWVESALKLHEAGLIPQNASVHLDQVALSVAVERLGLSIDCLDERFNFPAHLKPLSVPLPTLCHYHWPQVVRREPQLRHFVESLAEEHPALRTLLGRHPDWTPVLVSARKSPRIVGAIRGEHALQPSVYPADVRASLPEALITGIPRSGTSYLCRLFHSLENVIAINEPREIFEPLQVQPVPWGVATFHRELRRRILEGLPVENKLVGGRPVQDTKVTDDRVEYVPRVGRTDFLLLTKNTLAYLARIPQLRQVMPHAPIIACVRHPLDTVASWKTSFPHLEGALVGEIPVGHVEDPCWSWWHRRHLQEILALKDVAWRRALWWRFLANCILEHKDSVIVVRYEDLVRDPLRILQSLMARIPNAPELRPLGPIVPSSPKWQRNILDQRDLEAINAVCGEVAAEFVYEVAW